MYATRRPWYKIHMRPKSPKRERATTLEPRTPKQRSPSRAEREKETSITQSLYLEELAISGRHARACRIAGIKPGLPGYWERADEDFANRLAAAKRDAAHILEDACHKRATVGVPKPIFQRGALVGYQREYSDSLAQFLLRALKPEVYGMPGTMPTRVAAPGEEPSAAPPKRGLTKETVEVLRAEILGIKKA